MDWHPNPEPHRASVALNPPCVTTSTLCQTATPTSLGEGKFHSLPPSKRFSPAMEIPDSASALEPLQSWSIPYRTVRLNRGLRNQWSSVLSPFCPAPSPYHATPFSCFLHPEKTSPCLPLPTSPSSNNKSKCQAAEYSGRWALDLMAGLQHAC